MNTSTPRTENLDQILGNGVLAFGLVGFPLIASISEVLSLEGNYLSITYRVIYLMFCGLLVLRSIFTRRYRLDLSIIVFIFFYSCRILVDLNYSVLPHIQEDAIFYIGIVLLPVLCIGGGRAWYNERIALIFITSIGMIGNILIFYAIRTNLLTAFAVDSNVDTRASLTSLNPISVGYNGVFTAAAGLMLLLQVRSARWQIVCISAIVLSGYVVVEAAARGPIVGLLFGMAVTALTNKRQRISLTLASLVAAITVTFTGLPDLIFERFASAGTDLSSLDRLNAQSLSIDAALSSPWVGASYIEPMTGLYPHNLLIESALALGVIGLLLMSYLMFSMVVNLVRAAIRGEMLLPFLAMTQLVNAWISAALWSSVGFYTLLWIIRDHRNGVAPTPAAQVTLS